MKQIKDYIHFYIGKSVQVTGISKRFKPHCGPKVGDVITLSVITIELVLDGDLNIKLLLRPLSDMTKEEVKELFQYDKISKEYHHISFHRDVGLNGVLNGITIYYKVQTDEGELFPMSWTLKFNSMNADDFAWCLKKGFDMFQLIPAGLAIDKTTFKGKDMKEDKEKSHLERISLGECVSPLTVEHCPHCIDMCEASHWRIKLKATLQEAKINTDERNNPNR